MVVGSILLASLLLQAVPQRAISDSILDLELVQDLVEGSCNPKNFTAFYLGIREMEGVDRMFPSWPNGNLDFCLQCRYNYMAG